jgi:hypothetical protein
MNLYAMINTDHDDRQPILSRFRKPFVIHFHEDSDLMNTIDFRFVQVIVQWVVNNIDIFRSDLELVVITIDEISICDKNVHGQLPWIWSALWKAWKRRSVQV